MREVKEGKVTIQGHKAETLDILVRYAYAESVTITPGNAQVCTTLQIKLRNKAIYADDESFINS